MEDSNALKLAPQDNVAVAVRPIARGTKVNVQGAEITLLQDVRVGHKFALASIAPGEPILKYNCPIGAATRSISAGEYVHTHNVKSNYLPTFTLEK
jgi:altronate hydrolase